MLYESTNSDFSFTPAASNSLKSRVFDWSIVPRDKTLNYQQHIVYTNTITVSSLPALFGVGRGKGCTNKMPLKYGAGASDYYVISHKLVAAETYNKQA